MPTGTHQDQEKILQVIRELPSADQRECERLLREIGPLLLCRALHGMRRWYTGQTKAAADHVLRVRKALSQGMDLSPPIGAYRGFKYPKHLNKCTAGDRVKIPVTRNGGCSSWTGREELANKFSGATRDQNGIIVKLDSGSGVTAFIAPPEYSESWFNRLYASTMGTSHRHSECEFAIYAPEVLVTVVRVK